MTAAAAMGARLCLVGLVATLSAGTPAAAQPRPERPTGPSLSASRSTMAGSMLNVFVSRAPPGSRIAIARPADPAAKALIVEELDIRLSATLTVPGVAGGYELRLTRDQNGAPTVLLRQPLAATPPVATLSAPARVKAGGALPARGIGPNGERDRVVLVGKGASVEAGGPFFFPAQNVEATLEAPEAPGDYELRYVMDAPLSGPLILATRQVVVAPR